MARHDDHRQHRASPAATSAGRPFSALLPYSTSRHDVGDPAHELAGIVQRTLVTWSQATGITVQQVPDSSSPGSLPDIRVGFGKLAANALGQFDATSADSVYQPGAELLLEDPSASPLTGGGITQACQGTQAEFASVVESAAATP